MVVLNLGVITEVNNVFKRVYQIFTQSLNMNQAGLRGFEEVLERPEQVSGSPEDSCPTANIQVD